jgi:acylphosphatase
MATTYELRVYGKVQHVGFRDRIECIGRGLGISGVVYNHKDGSVRILANFDDEEDKELFKKYIERLEKKDKLIKIEKIEERKLDTYIEFPDGISRLSADDILELNKKLDEGVKYIKLIFGELECINSKLDSIDKRLDAKFDIIIKILKEIRDKL